ncbi:ChbG/HpnK family deacetylase [Crocinitomicaceae bacterium]|nr:ChbG/HpnK family deacetylase [Crocinitomicaceae bacterium]MDB3906137.1 ChbG/HpnK family deacetylase [Crocinitomicaceae bacterium]
MAKIIFNADDYGFCDQIDDGVIKAIDQGLINSVATVANGNNGLERLKRLAQMQDQADIGCHITITSGKPLTDAPSFTRDIDGKKYFRKFTQLERPKKNVNQDKAKHELKEEINAQIDMMEMAGINVKHLSSHHNSLIFFPEYFEAQVEIARDRGIKLRSTSILPDGKNNLYIAQLAVRSLDNLGVKNALELYTFMRKIDDWKSGYKQPIPAMPDAIDGSHYGPLGIDNIKTKNEFKREVRRKVRKLKKNLEELPSNAVMEYCIHMTDPDGLSSYAFTKEGTEDYYPGVDWKYFDSRKVEFASLEQLKADGEFPTLSRWDDI